MHEKDTARFRDFSHVKGRRLIEREIQIVRGSNQFHLCRVRYYFVESKRKYVFGKRPLRVSLVGADAYLMFLRLFSG
jgi:hypothetical protein